MQLCCVEDEEEKKSTRKTYRKNAGICVTVLSYILYKVKQKMNKLCFDAGYQTITAYQW